MGKFTRVAVCALIVVACAGGEAAEETPEPVPAPASGPWTPVPVTAAGLERIAWTEGDQLVINTTGGERTFVAGVNLGPTVPGTFPGEQAIPREAFRRWFPQMRDLGLRALRVYTIMPPAFYEELRAFNLAHPETPLLLVQGIWVNEEQLIAESDLFEPRLVDGFQAEIERAVAVVHGDITIPDQPGHAEGAYAADVSDWLMSWVIGIEWDPVVIQTSDTANAGREAFSGVYFENVGEPSPTEVWLAEMLEHLASLEADRGVAMPLAFVNWPTTDPLSHPDEPAYTEDLVGIDANHIQPTAAWPGGYYASYHAYPYYPDFQRYEAGIADFVHNGRTDAYAGYLTKLKAHHVGIPVAITEFGVPAGMAHAHFGPQGRNQGAHSEQDQMAINAELLDTIRQVGLAGGFVFEWADEWFKFTWNTIDHEIPWERRALWNNVWTNEAQFGVLAVGPGVTQTVLIDGDESEWAFNDAQVILESPSGVRQVSAVKDEGFLYIKIRTDGEDVWRSDPLVIGIDVIDGGGGGLPGTDRVMPEADYAVVLGPTEADGRIMVRASNDPYGITYAWRGGDEEVDPADFAQNSGVWNTQRLVVNRPLTMRSSGEPLPVEVFEAGRLIFGVTDPASPDFDSRAAWNSIGGVIEIRLPYQAIGFSDPSSMLAYRIASDGSVGTEMVERVGINVFWAGALYETNGYAWEAWQLPTWHERIKAGVDVFAAAVERGNSQRR